MSISLLPVPISDRTAFLCSSPSHFPRPGKRNRSPADSRGDPAGAPPPVPRTAASPLYIATVLVLRRIIGRNVDVKGELRPRLPGKVLRCRCLCRFWRIAKILVGQRPVQVRERRSPTPIRPLPASNNLCSFPPIHCPWYNSGSMTSQIWSHGFRADLGEERDATVGPCIVPKPSAWNPVEHSKWTSWHGLGNMASTEAMRLFVKILEVKIKPYVVFGINEQVD
ncbi:Acyl-CoA-binding domain-containing protein 5 [Apostasia shenzhenica]|uniref:Acyl-CoA-binding domain-containing protein 5 n=1 Tax=Apostasia shenzhenica TaxID=1088818 RepID=A0A2I0AH74_9ASPA|nr:Acyl-CoA-binding domain-containing protein 5 [Apostasia shenzhenica]